MHKEIFFCVYLFVINIASFLMFGIDKAKAKKGSWRIKEETLFTLALFGGSPGALIGMRVFHHKTRKKKFLFGIPLILLLQLLLGFLKYKKLI